MAIIGTSIGSRMGSRGGVRIGIGDASNPMAGVTKDASSGIYCPASAAEWTKTLSAAGLSSGGPSCLWLCQDASGNLADAIGSFTGTASSLTTYHASVTGWARKAVTTAAGGVGNVNNTSGSLPTLASASLMALAYINVTTTPGSGEGVIGFGTTTQGGINVTTAPVAQIQMGATTASGTSNPVGQVRPWVLKHNHTASAQAAYTDQDKVVPTFTSLIGQRIRMGLATGTTTAAQFLYCAWFFNSAAELTDAQIKKLLQTLGWSPSWS